MKIQSLFAFTIVFVAIIVSCKYSKKPTLNKLEFNSKNYNISLKQEDSLFLIQKYSELKVDKNDTLNWPLDVSTEEVVLLIDVSGTMFNMKSRVVRNGQQSPFFNYSLEKFITFLKSNNTLKSASKINIKLFGSKPNGLNISMDESVLLTVPRGKIILQEYFYKSDNNKIEINLLKYIEPKSNNIYSSVEDEIRKLTKPYYSIENSKLQISVKESPLLEDIVVNCEELNKHKGKKTLIYMTDGYFRIDGGKELIPESMVTLNELKDKFMELKKRIPNDSSFKFVFFGMKTTENFEFRDKLNGFYKWFLNDSINNVEIINLK